MSNDYNIKLSKLISELQLEQVYMPEGAEEITINSREVNRPGVEFNGYYDHFDSQRINIVGMGENAMLKTFSEERLIATIDKFFSMKPPAVIISRGMTVHEAFLGSAQKYQVPLLSSEDATSDVVAALVAYLNLELAERITRHGVFVEVYGEGILFVGDSGVGKSETAIELIKRGHRLIADDAVEIRKVSNKTLVGQAPENIRYFIELRGIGMVNARRIFGMGAVKISEKIDMIINLELWDSTKTYDRMGIDNLYTEILGIRVPVMTIPVKPGRNLAVIIEVAAMNNRQKKMGYNAAHELLANMGMDPSIMPVQDVREDIDI